jgi:hypothetical protein
MIEQETSISRNPRATFRRLQEGAGSVILHLDSAEYHGVNDVGSLVWTLLEEERSFSSLIDELRSHLESPPPALEDDISDFLGELADRDLIFLRGAASKDEPQP